MDIMEEIAGLQYFYGDDEDDMTLFEIKYTHKNEKEPYFTTTHKANSADEALKWANKQLTTDHDKDSVIEVSEYFV